MSILAFNWAYTTINIHLTTINKHLTFLATFIPASIDAYRYLNPANPTVHKRIVELELAHCIIHYLLVRSLETFGKLQIDILDNL